MQEKHIHYKIYAGGSRVIHGIDISDHIAKAESSNSTPPKYMFNTQKLNRAILLKDIMLDRLATGTRPTSSVISTKLFWPYDELAIDGGGESLFLADPHAIDSLVKKVGIQDISSPAWKEDKRILDILETLPSFDPFLLRDRFEIEGIPLHQFYYEISEQEWLEVRGFLRTKMAPMVTMAFGGNKNNDKQLDLFVDKIWSGKDIQDLSPLIQAFRLPAEDTEKILSGWKGIAYFEKQYNDQKNRLFEFAEWLKTGAVPLDFVSKAEQNELEALRTIIRERLREVWMTSIRIFSEYNCSYDELFGNKQNPTRFIAFINDSSAHFWTLGNTMTKLYNSVDIWNEFTQRFVKRKMKNQYLTELLYILKETL